MTTLGTFVQNNAAQTTLSVTVVGTGIMGSGITKSLLRSGIKTTVWNRTIEKAEHLAALGARVEADPRKAIAGADAIFVVLFDGDSVMSFLETTYDAAKPGAVWVQTATIGVDATNRVATFAEEKHINLVETLMMGSKLQAEEGSLILLGGGEKAYFEKLAPVWHTISKKLVYCGEKVGDGTVVKLACNSWVATITSAAAQAIALCQAYGLDAQLFLDSIEGATSDSPYAHIKGEKILTDEFSAQFSLAAVCKDLGLINQAAETAGVGTTIIDAVESTYQKALAEGHENEDLSSVYFALKSRKGDH